jgi:hypothetical protein
VNRTPLLTTLRQLSSRSGARALRVGGERGRGFTFTTDVVEAVLGANAGGDQAVCKIDLAKYPHHAMRRAATDILTWWQSRTGRGVALPEPGDVAEAKYPVSSPT